MGNYVTYLRWGEDPDKVGPVSGMSPRDIYFVQSSWKPVYAQAASYGVEMFLRLFRKDPKTKTFFQQVRDKDEAEIVKSYQFKGHVITLMAAINSAVINLHDPEVVVALMNKLGATHCARNVEKVHFEEFKEVWIDVLRNDLKMDQKMLKSWNNFIDFIYIAIFVNFHK